MSSESSQKVSLETFFQDLSLDDVSVIQDHLHACVDQFSPLAFPPDFGFDGFSLSDLEQFIVTDTQFQLSMNKVTGKGILYGVEHVRVRQAVFNGLPLAVRLAIMCQKIKRLALWPCLRAYDPGFSEETLQDVQDIGAVHSVYVFTFSSGKRVVVKREALPNQVFYTQLLGVLGVPTFMSMHFENAYGGWEVTSYLGERSLNQTLLNLGEGEGEAWVVPLAEQAAIGDCFGRGDRHFDNYMCQDGLLYPVDISYLFWPDNLSWVLKYVSSGMAEYAILAVDRLFTTGFDQRRDSFFKAYEAMTMRIFEHRDAINDLIRSFYTEKGNQVSEKVAYFKTYEAQFSAQFGAVKASYDQALDQYREKLPYKTRLEQLFQENKLEGYPSLKMYAYAHQDRLSAFFLGDCDRLFPKISGLSG